jgi:hypothetical protein
MQKVKTRLGLLINELLDKSRFYAGIKADMAEITGQFSAGHLCTFHPKFIKEDRQRFFLIAEIKTGKTITRAEGFMVTPNPLRHDTTADDLIVAAGDNSLHIPLMVQFWNRRLVRLSHLFRPIAFLSEKTVEKAILCFENQKNLPGATAVIFRNYEIENSPGIPAGENVIEILFLSGSKRYARYQMRQDNSIEFLAAASERSDFQSRFYKLLNDFILLNSPGYLIRNLGKFGLKIIGINNNKFCLQLKFRNCTNKIFASEGNILVLSSKILSELDFADLNGVKVAVKLHE